MVSESIGSLIIGKNLAFSSKASDSVMCQKFQMILIQYDGFPNEQLEIFKTLSLLV